MNRRFRSRSIHLVMLASLAFSPLAVAVSGAPARAGAALPWGISAAAAADDVPASEAPREIAALLSLLRVSPCRFQRNGRWYDGERASAHLQRKLDHAVARGRTVDDTEYFIDQAATRSSLTGRPYLVQCGDAAPVPSARWFRARLAELRT